MLDVSAEGDPAMLYQSSLAGVAKAQRSEFGEPARFIAETIEEHWDRMVARVAEVERQCKAANSEQTALVSVLRVECQDALYPLLAEFPDLEDEEWKYGRTPDPLVLKKQISNLKHRIVSLKRTIAERDVMMLLLRGKLQRREAALSYIQTTLYQEVSHPCPIHQVRIKPMPNPHHFLFHCQPSQGKCDLGGTFCVSATGTQCKDSPGPQANRYLTHIKPTSTLHATVSLPNPCQAHL